MRETGPRPTGGRQAISGSAGRTVTVRVVRPSRSNWTVAEVARRRSGVVVVLGPVQQQLAALQGVRLPRFQRCASSPKATRLVGPIRASKQS